MLARLRTDVNADELLKLSMDDVDKGRMIGRLAVDDVDLSGGSIASRFGVVQGVLANGKPKVRAVDNMSESKVNEATVAQEKLKYTTLDYLFECMQHMMLISNCLLGLWKADVDSAYRRVPLLPRHRRHAKIAFKCNDRINIFQHCATPFGALSSVHHWERIGTLLCTVARRILHLPVFRFVDDFFAACRGAVAEHSMQIFAMLVHLFTRVSCCMRVVVCCEVRQMCSG